VQLEVHFRIAGAEGADHLREHVARLRVGRRDRQRAFLLGREIAGEARDVVRFAQNLARPRDNFAAGRGDRGQALALAREQLHAELRLELLQLLADTGLARVETLGGRGDVEPAIDDADQVLELLQSHCGGPGTAVGLYNHSLKKCVNNVRSFAYAIRVYPQKDIFFWRKTRTEYGA